MSGGTKKVYFPKTRLSELLKRPGGIARDVAIETAMAEIQSMSGESDAMIRSAIEALDKIVAGGRKNGLSEADMTAILNHADQVVTLAGTFGYRTLDETTRSLCDVTAHLVSSGLRDVAPIAVHVDAMRMFAPGAEPLPDTAAYVVLGELKKVLSHYSFSRPAVEDEV